MRKGGQPSDKGKRLSVVFRLPARVHHERVPCARGVALPARRGRRLFRQQQVALFGYRLRAAGPPALLGLQNERAALVEVDTPARGGAVRFAESHGALEGVGVGRGVMRGLIGAWNVQHVAKLGKEKRIIGALLSAVAIAPTGEEGFQRFRLRFHGGRNSRVPFRPYASVHDRAQRKFRIP